MKKLNKRKTQLYVEMPDFSGEKNMKDSIKKLLNKYEYIHTSLKEVKIQIKLIEDKINEKVK